MIWFPTGSAFALAIGVAVSGCVREEISPQNTAQPTLIPLSEVWAFEMPDTRDVRELEPENFGEQVKTLPDKEQSRRLHESLTQQIRNSLPYLRVDKGQKPSAGFAVVGSGTEALQRAYNVLIDDQTPHESFAASDEISIVFFSHRSARYVHLNKVARQGESVKVHYRLVPHSTNEVTEHFALIPLGQLPVGRYRVKMIESATGKPKPVDTAKRSSVVCGPFSFFIVNQQSD